MRYLLATVLLLCATASAQDSGTLQIYRCTAADGSLSLRDSPCPDGQKQQQRSMLRPKDAPTAPTPAASSKPASNTLPAATTTTVYLAAPQPMYECITADGQRYTSERGDGNPRWEPSLTFAYPVGYPLPRPSPLGSGNGWSLLRTGGNWVRDHCVMLPPAEACARLRDRRSEIRTRFFNAQPSERDHLRLEERSINARLDNDCGGR